jgi:membrane protein implicated in regulation of membrane protease activity
MTFTRPTSRQIRRGFHGFVVGSNVAALTLSLLTWSPGGWSAFSVAVSGLVIMGLVYGQAYAERHLEHLGVLIKQAETHEALNAELLSKVRAGEVQVHTNTEPLRTM